MSAVGPPSGVVTFLFTDVEGSTRRWETDADEMRTALVVHDEVLRNAIDAHDGFLFKHTGDGVCAAFASPKAAVDAAVAVQRELAFPVRMGLATGEAQLRDGDYFGAVLNRAARVMSAGHGGQILMADSTASLLSGVDLVDLGPRRLRDLPTPMGVFQVRAQGLLTDFPPLRGVDSNPGNLRPAILGLIGRDSEVSAIQSALRSHRLVTLTGVGGVGKTCLALEVATQLADEFPDGVWVFELAGIADPGAVPDAVAAVFGNHAATRQERGAVSGFGPGGQVAAIGVRQLRTGRLQRRGSGRGDPRDLGDRDGLGDQSRRNRHRRRTTVAGTFTERRRGNCVIRRTRPTAWFPTDLIGR